MSAKKQLPRGERFGRLEQARRNLSMSLDQFYRKAGLEEIPPIPRDMTLTHAATAKHAMERGEEFYIHPYVHRLIDRTLGPKTSGSAQRRQDRLERRHKRMMLSQQDLPGERANA